MVEELVKVGVKANIVDEGFDVFYHPMFYSKHQAYDILQQLKTEIVNESRENLPFILELLSLSNRGHQVATGDKEAHSQETYGQWTMEVHFNEDPQGVTWDKDEALFSYFA